MICYHLSGNIIILHSWNFYPIQQKPTRLDVINLLENFFHSRNFFNRELNGNLVGLGQNYMMNTVTHFNRIPVIFVQGTKICAILYCHVKHGLLILITLLKLHCSTCLLVQWILLNWFIVSVKMFKRTIPM